jgi:capsid protein
VFIESTAKTPSLLSVTAEQYGYRLDQDLEPGMIFKLNKDEKVSTLVPNFPTPELEPFVIMLARRIGAALGVSWQIVLKDFSKANYSSARTDLLEARGVWLIMQDLFRERILDWMWFQVLADARLRGDPRVQGLSDDDLRAVYWIAPGWRWVDPLKEAQAAEVRVRLGLDTIRDLCAADGKDWEEQLAQAALEMKRRAELGLPAAAVPGAPAAADAGESLVSVEEAA